LLPNAKRIIPNPSKKMVIGHGKGHPNRGFGMPVAISIESIISNMPAMMRGILEAINIIHLL
jgi:hypothetical protein